MNVQSRSRRFPVLWRAAGHRGRARRRSVLGPFAESLERRQVPALLAIPAAVSPVLEAEPDETVDLARPLGDLSASPMAAAHGTIGDGPAGAADVDWYHFTLDAPAVVRLVAGPSAQGDGFQGALSLYNEDLYDFGDPLDPLGRRALVQSQAGAPGDLVNLSATLGPGAYDIAVSGAGNLCFDPMMAGSGYPGSTGDYNLVVSSQALALPAGSGPILLASSPMDGAALDSSPLAIRLDLSGPLDPDTVAAGTTVQLLTNPTGTFGDGKNSEVTLSSVNFSPAVDELQLFPDSALPPGYYQVVLSGDAGAGAAVLTDPNGIPLGADTAHPQGQDVRVSFRVTGIEGGRTADDTLDTAHELGDVTDAPIVQVAGAIGDDPNYNAASTDPALNPGNDVDFYRFHLDGAGPYALTAEVFAGRIGSPLDPGIALYRVDPATNGLQFIAGDNNTNDQATADDGSDPLLTDAALFASLKAGDYILAVSSGSNTPSPLEGQAPGTPGLYDPNVSHSGQDGWSTGPYVLNLQVRPAPAPPRVVATSPADGSVLTAPPTQLTVQFSEPVDLQQVAYRAYQENSQGGIACVYIQGADGTKYFPRLQSIDAATDRATFLMLDGLPDGSYQLHLSGAQGLTDQGGNPLVGNDPSGDYVVHFTVAGAPRGDGGDPQTWSASPATGGGGVDQDLGVLFPHEIQSGVTVIRTASGAADPATDEIEDTFRFQVLQDQVYTFSVQSSGPMPSDALWLTHDHRGAVGFGPLGDNGSIQADLTPGSYVIHVGTWSPAQAASLTYRLTIGFIGNADNPVPLVDGPAPAIQVSLASAVSVPGTASPGELLSLRGPLVDAVDIEGSASAAPVEGSGVAGPMAGGSAMVGPMAGGSAMVGPMAGGSGSGSTPVVLASAYSQPEAFGGLSGLALGPLGGAGTPAGAIASPTVQVALNIPLAPAPALSSLAAGLVTLTQMIPPDLQGQSEFNDEAIAPVESPVPPGLAATQLPGPSGGEPGSADGGPLTEPRGDLPAPLPAPATVRGPEPDLVSAPDLSTIFVPLHPVVAASAPAPQDETSPDPTPAAPGPIPATGEEAPLEPSARLVGWAITAATLVAVSRGREVIRGLRWTKGAGEGGVSSGGPTVPRASRDRTRIAHPAGWTLVAHVWRLRSRRRLHAVSPRP